MENTNSTQTKIQMLQKKVDKACEAIQNLAKSQYNSTEKIKEKLSNLILKISQLQGRCQKDQVNLKYLQIQLNSHKQSFNKLLQVLNDKIQNNVDTTKQLKVLLNSLNTELYTLRKQLSENNGQTNQCFIQLDKLCKRLEQLNPLNIKNQPMLPTQPLQIQKKVKKILFKAVLGILIPVILYVIYFFGSLVYNKFIDAEYKKIHSSEVQMNGDNKK